MNHPYFGGVEFPWWRADAQRLLSVLTVVASDKAEIENLYLRCAKGLTRLTPSRADLMWIEALNNLAAAGALERLCDLFLARTLAAEARAAFEQVRSARPEADQPPAEPGPIVLDRTNLRQQIQRLTPGSAALKVLVVRGDPGSGKSHGRYLFEQAARGQNAQPVYLCADIVANLDEVLHELFGALKATSEIPAAGDTTSSAFHKRVWLRLREIADREKRALWIAIDDLGNAPDGGPLLEGEIRQFFDQLVLQFVNPPYRDWFRLMLIHYPDGKVPSKWRREMWTEDRTSADDVRSEHVAEELRAWYQRHGQTVVEEEIDTLAADIVARSGKLSDDDRLRRIHDSVYEILESSPGPAR
ncbi:hypothetical protein [Paractinoplanes lichenicola]|uniref:ATP-binding protein n=1 Tax=Paractinoplanes lichenicola TaxID=2802976 RepID=A0ABS1VXM5_9ACTN|nr:hypothetical protein [Actinoplanes lichenicola]MBL7259237.1 hypothetical protein [Actinoplanes lichenicola]